MRDQFTRMKMVLAELASLLIFFIVLPYPALANEFDVGQSTLNELIKSARQNALENRIAKTELAAMRYQLAALEARSSIELVANGGWNLNQSVISPSSSLTYQTVGAGFGIQVPLLGAAEKQKSAIRTARLSIAKGAENSRAAKITVTSLVLKANSEWYFSLRRISLARAFLQSEAAARMILLQRTRAHRLLQSDQLDFLSTFDTVRSVLDVQRTNVSMLRSLLQQLTGKDLSNYIPTRPALPHDLDQFDINECIDQSPAFRIAQDNLDAYSEAQNHIRWEGVNAYLSVSKQFNYGIGIPTGGATGINLTVDMPLNILALRRATRDAAQMRTLEAQLDLQLARQNALRDLRKTYASYLERRDALQAWNRQLQAAFAAWDIAYKRIQGLPGDTLEKLLQARYLLYQTTLNHIKAQEAAATSAIDYSAQCGWDTRTLSSVVGQDDFSAHVPKETFITSNESVMHDMDSFSEHPFSATLAALILPLTVTSGASDGYLGWYVWDSHNLLAHPQDIAQLPPQTQLLSLSFTESQLNSLKNAPSSQHELRQFLQIAHAHKLLVNWLIGDPTLALPEGRKFLRAWLPTMQQFDFDGVDIDAEQDQLPESLRSSWPEGILRTLALFRQQTAWPVTLTMNWHSLDINKFPNALADSGVSRVNVMLYVRNSNRTVDIMGRLLTAEPGLPLALAQSVEPDIDSSESLASLGSTGALQQLSLIEHQLRRFPNYKGIMVQSWDAFIQLGLSANQYHQQPESHNNPDDNNARITR